MYKYITLGRADLNFKIPSCISNHLFWHKPVGVFPRVFFNTKCLFAGALKIEMISFNVPIVFLTETILDDWAKELFVITKAKNSICAVF